MKQLPRSPAFPGLALAALLALLTAPAPSSADDGERRAEKAVREALPTELTSLFPVGRVFEGVSIPSYSNETLDSVMRAATIERVDERHLDFVDLEITIHGNSGPESTIFMAAAVHDLATGRLTSTTPARIQQPRFTMTGEQMTFDTRSQRAHLRGNVRLVVPEPGAIAPDIDDSAPDDPPKSKSGSKSN